MVASKSAVSFLAKAQEADEIAAQCMTQVAAAAWLDVAREYRLLADLAKRSPLLKDEKRGLAAGRSWIWKSRVEAGRPSD